MVLDFTKCVRREQWRLVKLSNQHVGIEVARWAVQGEVPEEIAALHSLLHGLSYKTCRLAERCRDRLVLALAALDKVPVIAGKKLVAAVAGQDDGHAIGSQLRNHVRGDRRRIAERLIQVPCDVVNNVKDIRLDNQLVMFRSE